MTILFTSAKFHFYHHGATSISDSFFSSSEKMRRTRPWVWGLRVCSWTAHRGDETWSESQPGRNKESGCRDNFLAKEIIMMIFSEENLFTGSALWEDVVPTDPHSWQVDPFRIRGTFDSWFSVEIKYCYQVFSSDLYPWTDWGWASNRKREHSQPGGRAASPGPATPSPPFLGNFYSFYTLRTFILFT